VCACVWGVLARVQSPIYVSPCVLGKGSENNRML